MAKSLLIGAVACATVSCVLLIVAMASSAWMTGCLSYEKIFAAAKELDVDLPHNYNQAGHLLRGEKLCIHLGLFKITMRAANLINISLGIDIFLTPIVVQLGAIAMIFSVVWGAVAVILLVAATCGGSDSCEAKSAKLTTRGIVLLFLAGFAGLLGMVCYTAETANALSNPLTFMAHVGTAAGSSLKDKLMDGEYPSLRGKRDLSLSGLDPSMTRFLNKMTEGLVPGYGFAFGLGWASLAFMVIAAILAATVKQHPVEQPHHLLSNMKP